MSDLEHAYLHCEELVRKADHDRYLASLFAEARLRKHLMALYAFNLEIASVRERVSDPLPGEMRLQWWHDVLRGEAAGDVCASSRRIGHARHGETVSSPR